MLKSAVRVAPRRILPSRSLISPTSPRRFLSTAPPSQKSRSWKSSAARWALAAGGIYYYNTSNVFAEEPEAAIQQLGESLHSVAESNLPTVDAVVEEKRQRQAQQLAEEQKRESAKQQAVSEEGQIEGEEGSLEGLEDEADQQGAFNPETGEINWDCPCLGGMAHGPCGEEFRAAFSCFVYSKEEPKGVECIEKFKGMQDCFREHPEMYGSELDDDEDEIEEELQAREQAKQAETESATPKSSTETSPVDTQKVAPGVMEKKTEEPHRDSQSPAGISGPAGDEGGDLVPRAAHDASSK